MRITASMEAAAQARHRWHVAVFSAAEPSASATPRASYGARIGAGETQRIHAASLETDSVCHVSATLETTFGSEPDVGEVTLDGPDDLKIRFYRRGSIKATDGEDEDCTLAFEFSPARS
jgi:hypothetical protein